MLNLFDKILKETLVACDLVYDVIRAPITM